MCYDLLFPFIPPPPSSMLFGSLSCMYLLASFIRLLLGGERSTMTLAHLIDQHDIEYGWALKLLVNCFGYACVIVPGVLIYQYAKRINYLQEGRCECDVQQSGPCRNSVLNCFLSFAAIGCIPDIVKFCLRSGDTVDTTASPSGGSLAGIADTKPTSATSAIGRTTSGDCLLYAYCFVGLNISYLSWGLLQEKIITQEYRDADGRTAHFRDSQFLVFVNRALAFAVAGAWLRLTQTAQRHRAPLFKYSYASLSNIMSAWFQYEALKFVSFPTQVLAKSCKIMPVMLMGRIVSRTRYEFYEYLTACLISLGMVCFLLGSADDATTAHQRTSITTMAGVLLLTLYLVFDSFTANWQSDLFRTYQMTPVQMMCGVSGFSTLFTAASLAVQGGFAESVQFAAAHPKFVVDCVVLSASSAVGQLFIFYTISKFGAVGFTIIMTIRQVSGRIWWYIDY